MNRTNLDMDALRTLVMAHRLGGFNRAADFIGRSQSAVSQQIKKLEERVGESLLEKQGRGLVFTPAGEILLAYARRIIDLNDAATIAVRGRAIEGVARLGIPADFADGWLPKALGVFRRAHPSVRIEAVIDRNRLLLERLDRGELDLVLALGNGSRADAESLCSLPFEWIGPATGESPWADAEPIPLAVFESPCFFHRRALDALDRAGLPWRIAFTSPSINGIWAAVAAGLGVTLRTRIRLPMGVQVVGLGTALPSLEDAAVEVCIHDGGRVMEPMLLLLRSIIRETLMENVFAS